MGNYPWPDNIDELYGESYLSVRQDVLERDGGACRVCGSSGKVHTHHIKPRSSFENVDDSNTMDNLITLCPSCHGKLEGRWEELSEEEFASRATALDDLI